MDTLKLIELTLVISCLSTSVFCFIRLFIHTIRLIVLSRRFRARLAIVDPVASRSVFTSLGIKEPGLNDSFSMARYIHDKGPDADSTLGQIEKAYNAPFKHGMITLLLIPGGFMAAILVIVFFKTVYHLNY